MSLSDLLALSRRDLWRVIAAGAVLFAGCLWLSFRFLEPIPPRKIVLASGPESSLYHQHAQRHKEALAREGVTLEERMTEGADNLRLLFDRNSGVDIGFVEGGVARFPEADSVVMVAACITSHCGSSCGAANRLTRWRNSSGSGSPWAHRAAGRTRWPYRCSPPAT